MNPNYKIYWIDDEDDFPASLKEMIEIEFSEFIDFGIDFAHDGERLQDKIQSEHIDLLILDWNINGDKTGLQLIEELRSSGEQMEIIFYSFDDDVLNQFRDSVGVHTCINGEVGDKINQVIRRFQERTQNVQSKSPI